METADRGAPRRLSHMLPGLARGVCLASALVATGAQACRQAPEAKAVPGSIVTQTSDDPLALQSAWYEDLTDAYPHGVLGDALEPTVLRAVSGATSASCGVSVSAGEGFVFEDIAPRLADVDGDGRPEVIAVRTAFNAGGQLVVYALRGESLEPLAATPHIGRRNRWLAPAAIADLDGDGAVEIAFVDRPHLAKTLRIWRFDDGAFREVATASGVSNHRIGEDFISGGLRVCEGAPSIVLASGDWRRLLALSFDGQDITARDLGPWSRQAAGKALTCEH